MLSRSNILYLSRNMAGYRFAGYQQEVIDELDRQANVGLYGPGYKAYDDRDSIKDVLKKDSRSIDLIIIGHSWLSDEEGEQVDPHPRLNLSSANIPSVAILNKEYVNLDQKLLYYVKNGVSLVFSHHHAIDVYARQTGIRFIFWPFGFDRNKYFMGENLPRDIDLMFSGILQNQNKKAEQSVIRPMVMNKLFHCIGDIPFSKRRSMRSRAIMWNGIPRLHRSLIYRVVNWIPHPYRYRFIDERQYAKKLLRSRIVLNTLSPKGLVSPRYFESMASGAMVLCEEADTYRQLFPDDCYVSFRSDLSDFLEKLVFFLDNESSRKLIASHARRMVMANHSWEKRIATMLQHVAPLIIRKGSNYLNE